MGLVDCKSGLQGAQVPDAQSAVKGLQASFNFQVRRSHGQALFGVGQLDLCRCQGKAKGQVAALVTFRDKGNADLAMAFTLVQRQWHGLGEVGKIKGQIEVLDIAGEIGLHPLPAAITRQCRLAGQFHRAAVDDCRKVGADSVLGLKGEVGEGWKVEFELFDVMFPVGHPVIKEDAAVADGDIVQREEQGWTGFPERIFPAAGAVGRGQGRQVVRLVRVANECQSQPLNLHMVGDKIVAHKGCRFQVDEQVVNLQKRACRRCGLSAVDGDNVAQLQPQGKGIKARLASRQANVGSLLQRAREISGEP